MIAVIVAHQQGKQIECRPNHTTESFGWAAVEPGWDFMHYDFRVKPPKPREWWLDPKSLSAYHSCGPFASTSAAFVGSGCVKVREVLP